MMFHYCFDLFIRCGIAIFIFQTLMFLLASAKKNNGLVDIGWGLGFIVVSFISVFARDSDEGSDYDWTSQGLIASFTVIWALRLSIYLFIRNWEKPEDWRYANWRKEWGSSVYVRSFFQVFMLQGLLMLVIASPIILSFSEPFDIQGDHYFHWFLGSFFLISGIAFWLIGFIFQSIGDYQLYQFKKDNANKGRIMRYGLWRYTRHPNYFGETAMWWGIFLISCISAHDLIGVALRMIGPATITFLLLRVSGVTMLEGKYKGNEEYENYQRNTSSFLPMIPKNKT